MELIKINIFEFRDDPTKKIWVCDHYLMTDKRQSMDRLECIAKLVNKIVAEQNPLGLDSGNQISYETSVVCTDGSILLD
jgi:hypothetical protein